MRRFASVLPSLATVLATALSSSAIAAIFTITPANNIQATINGAASGDTIRFTPGTYNQVAFITGKSLILEGMAGSNATIWTAANLANSVLQVVNAPAPGVTIRGLTIRDGITPGSANTPDGHPNDGGGVSASNSALIIEQCRFANNHAGDDGGAIRSATAAVSIADTTFDANTAGGAGGAIILGGSVTIVRSTFSNNQSVAGGGAAYILGATPATFTDTSFSGNSTTNATSGLGGGVYNSSVSGVTFSNCAFTSNSAVPQGGAVYAPPLASLGTMTFNLCSFTGNFTTGATSDGGAIIVNANMTLAIDRCTFTRNRVLDDGGAVFKGATSGTLTITRSGFFGNFARRGGCVFSDPSTQISNSLFVGNECTSSGGALHLIPTAGITDGVRHCTFVANQGPQAVVGGAPSGGGGSTFKSCVMWSNANVGIGTGHAVTHSNVQQAGGVYAGVGNINAAPLFDDAAGAGTDGDWGTGDDDYGNLRLLAGSPGIDAGDSPAALNLLVDHAGLDRNRDDPATANTGLAAWSLNVDMGAYEHQPVLASPCVADVDDGSGSGTPDGGVTIEDLLYFLGRFDAGC